MLVSKPSLFDIDTCGQSLLMFRMEDELIPAWFQTRLPFQLIFDGFQVLENVPVVDSFRRFIGDFNHTGPEIVGARVQEPFLMLHRVTAALAIF